MRVCNKCERVLPLARFSKNTKRHDGLCIQCKDCMSKSYRAFYERNRERLIKKATASTRKRREREEVREQDRISSREAKRRQLADPTEYEKHLARGRAWRAENKDRARLFKHEQPYAKAARAMRRFATKLRATPPWADHELIDLFYVECATVSERSGVPHEVDHIFPLQGRGSCGLHIPTNLRIITAAENRAKGNKHPALTV